MFRIGSCFYIFFENVWNEYLFLNCPRLFEFLSIECVYCVQVIQVVGRFE